MKRATAKFVLAIALVACAGCCVCRRGVENAGYDHNWCLDGESFRKVAVLRGKKLEMEVWTDQPGLQFYAGGTINTGWRISRNRPLLRNGYLALETQHWPDSPNRPDFASTVLRPGETFRSATEYRFRPR